MSGGHGWQADGCIIADGAHRLQCHVACAPGGPFVGLLEQDGTHQPGDCSFVRKDANNIGAALDLTVEPLDGVGAVQPGNPGSDLSKNQHTDTSAADGPLG